MRVKFFAIFCQSISLIFFSVNCVCSGGARLHPEMIEIALKYSMAAMHIPMPFDICCQIDSLSLVWYHRHHKPTQFDQIWNSIWLFWRKIIFIMQTCLFGLIYFIIYFLLWLNIHSNFVTECLPPCCISYILDHLWRNIILEICMYF